LTQNKKYGTIIKTFKNSPERLGRLRKSMGVLCLPAGEGFFIPLN
jgi:hypothetical protein